MLKCIDCINLLLVLFICTIHLLVTSLISPSIPGIASFFHVSIGQSQAVLVYYQIGLVLSILFYGPLSVLFGPKKILLFGMLFSLTALLFGLMSHTIGQLKCSMFFQGIGVGACASLWRAVFNSLFTGKRYSFFYLILNCSWLVLLIFPPFLGSIMQAYFGWRGNFTFLFVTVLIGFVSIFFALKLNNQASKRSVSHWSDAFKDYRVLLFNRRFMSYAGVGMFAQIIQQSLLVCYPAILISGYRLPVERYGFYLLIANILGIISPFVNQFIRRYVSLECILKVTVFFFLIDLLSMIYAYYHIHYFLLIMILSYALLRFLLVFVFVNSFFLAFETIDVSLYCASSLYPFLSYIGAAVVTGVLSSLSTTSVLPLCVVILMCAAGMTILLYGKKPVAVTA